METLAHLATVVTGVVAFIALYLGYKQVHISIEANKEAAAVAAYKNYLAACVENPKLSSYKMFIKCHPTAFKTGIGDRANIPVQKYLWFLSALLNTLEEIAGNIAVDDPAWRRVIKKQIALHCEILETMWPRWYKGYSKELDRLVREVLEDWREEEAARQAQKAESVTEVGKIEASDEAGAPSPM